MTTQITITPEFLSPYQVKAPKAPEIVNENFFSAFSDLLDIVNPLQHIPVVSSIYRQVTDDNINPGAKLAGGALFGGAIGFFSSIANFVIESETGKDIAGNIFAAAASKYEKTNLLT